MDFLAEVIDQPLLYVMDDPLSGVNVLEYRDGEARNWHFDRSIFTTTLLLQAPDVGGAIKYAKDLRSDDDPNHTGVADLLLGRTAPTQMQQDAGTLNVFPGRNTAHRVSRIVAVLAHYDSPGVALHAAKRMGFYGRTA